MGGVAKGNVDVVDRGSLGGVPRGGGGATAGMFTEDRGIGGATMDGFRDATVGGAGLDVPGGGGGARGGVTSDIKLFDRVLTSEVGRCRGLNGGFRRLAIK